MQLKISTYQIIHYVCRASKHFFKIFWNWNFEEILKKYLIVAGNMNTWVYCQNNRPSPSQLVISDHLTCKVHLRFQLFHQQWWVLKSPAPSMYSYTCWWLRLVFCIVNRLQKWEAYGLLWVDLFIKVSQDVNLMEFKYYAR